MFCTYREGYAFYGIIESSYILYEIGQNGVRISSMVIISHRGYWKKDEEKNSVAAIERSFKIGCGVEIDIRDYKGEIVISHGIADGASPRLEKICKIYRAAKLDVQLALNIKSDGLQVRLKKLLNQYRITNYFVFDMSVPEALSYIGEDMNVFTRQSEHETKSPFYNEARGIWLDEFCNHWISEEIIKEHVDNGKKACIVSPELHGRAYQKEWNDYRKIGRNSMRDEIMICTDFPEEAKKFFG